MTSPRRSRHEKTSKRKNIDEMKRQHANLFIFGFSSRSLMSHNFRSVSLRSTEERTAWMNPRRNGIARIAWKDPLPSRKVYCQCALRMNSNVLHYEQWPLGFWKKEIIHNFNCKVDLLPCNDGLLFSLCSSVLVVEKTWYFTPVLYSFYFAPLDALLIAFDLMCTCK